MSKSIGLSKDKNWWRQAAVYQIYPRSFADSNGDGIGDLKGVTSRIPYLQSLSIDAVWLSPFYPSALVDGGYDVDDYRNVDPKLGTLADFDEMLAELHKVGIRVYVDIVPNHSSNLHVWFKEAIASEPGSKARSRYLFRDGKGVNGELPPTDWVSHFAPSAWTHESAMGGKHNQWYMHWFAPEQPDFNWDNREVHDEFLKTLKFWADRGVDAFRIDVAHALKKDLSEPLRNLNVFEGLEERGAKGKGILADRDEVFAIYKEWRNLFNQYDPPRVAVAEANVHPERLPLYASTKTLGQSFDFRFIDTPFEATAYKESVQDALRLAAKNKSSCTWTLSNHDQIRHATKMGLNPAVDRRSWMLTDGTSHPLDKASGTQNALAASLFILALPGCTYMYQGEELGLHEVTDIPEDRIQDPQYLRNLKVDKGRDGCRVPLPWKKSGTSFGFGTGSAHLPQPNWFGDYSVEAEEKDSLSALSIYRKALEIRKGLVTEEKVKWHKTGNSSVLHFSRPNGWHCITNFRAAPIAIPKGELLISSHPLQGGKIAAGTTVWFKKEKK
ncbi:AmyA Glycosidases [Candidatus Nanopelagicaceae bacterium]